MVRNSVWEEPQDEEQERAGGTLVGVAGEGQLSSGTLGNEPKALLELEAEGSTCSWDEQLQVSEDMLAFKTPCWRWR